jgi:hypothetical protein
MCTTRRPLALLATIGLLGLGAVPSGCARAVDPMLFYGTYPVSVTAFGKSDPTIVVVSDGREGDILFNFTHGFTTEYGAPNATGVRVALDDAELVVESQPIHVEHSSGTIDGTMTGRGTTSGQDIDLTLSVVPTNVIILGPDGQPLPPGTTVDYVVKGQK